MIIPTTPLIEENQNSQPTQTSQATTLAQALDFLQNCKPSLLHLPSVEAEAFFRLQKYPKQIVDSLHHALVLIPRNLAYILHDKAAYISPATEAFYLRDPISMRSVYASDPSKRRFPLKDLVTVSVTFTKVGYAQLRSQQFAPPPAWSDILATYHDAKSQNRAEMGMKITCGFEMMISDVQNRDSKVVQEIQLLLDDIETGEDHLPSDNRISTWNSDEDDESWLNINFEQFEEELAGKSSKKSSTNTEGFGNKAAQENLRKMVARFEDFLNDESAGPEGAEYLDDMDKDSDADADDDEFSDCASESEEDDEEVTFDEDRFSTMMKEMMSIPNDQTTKASPDSVTQTAGAVRYDSEVEDEGDNIRQVMHDVGSELRVAGALRLERATVTDKTVQQTEVMGTKTRALDRANCVADEGIITENEDLNIDYNLVKNLLESFKSQGGVPGPGGNMMGLMGMHMPRDEEDKFPNP